MRTGRPDEAITLFRHAIELDPDSPDALLYMAGALAATGRPADALPYFERSIKAGPPTTMAWQLPRRSPVTGAAPSC